MGLQIRPLAVPEKVWERRAGCSPWFSYRICSEARAFMYGQMKYWTVPIDQSKVDFYCDPEQEDCREASAKGVIYNSYI